MKIGLLTYHHSTNIGAMMQTYATCRALIELGHEVVIVDIRQPERHRQGIIMELSKIVFGKHQKDLDSFEKHFYPPLTRRYLSVEELRIDPPKVDCLVVGSDQTWNPEISKEMAMAYFLDFGGENLKRFSYASSFGMDYWKQNSDLTNDVFKALQQFENISVRERTAVKICRDTFMIDADLVADPTLLFNCYPEITGDVKPKSELLCYKLQRNEDFYRNIDAFKHIMDLPARLLNNFIPVRGLRYTYPPSVRDWIRRIGGAEFVLTDSFHGVAFSLLYQRQFVVIRCHDGRDSRFEDLLHELDLDNRVFDSMSDLVSCDDYKEKIDYDKVAPKLSKIRNSSWDYLRKALL